MEASNGASDYGNKFGEPVIAGFARSFGMILKNKERREWVKPIMFSGGIGCIDGRHVSKCPAEKGLLCFFLYLYSFCAILTRTKMCGLTEGESSENLARNRLSKQ